MFLHSAQCVVTIIIYFMYAIFVVRLCFVMLKMLCYNETKMMQQYMLWVTLPLKPDSNTDILRVNSQRCAAKNLVDSFPRGFLQVHLAVFVYGPQMSCDL